jgi:hypothetical protein
MKKIILSAALLVTLLSTQAITITPSESGLVKITAGNNQPIPLATGEAYRAMYPGATTLKAARKGEGVYSFTFIYNGVKMTASFNYLGVYLGA